MKTCKDCGELKPFDDFHRNRAALDGRRNVCKACAGAATAAYRLAEAERVNAYAYEYRRRADVMARNRDQGRTRHGADRAAAFARYGEQCAACGSMEDLQIDHIDDSGDQHRSTDPEARTIYRWLRKHGYPDGFQTLCQPCNLAKARAPRQAS